ncbi:MAG: methyltransferase family protein [Anaerolineaceae bacterium]
MNKKATVLYILNQILGLAGMAVAIFWSAGRMDWWPAWAAIAIWVVWFAITDFLLLRKNPDLIAERISPPKGAKTWDRAILSILRLAQLARYILAGLDFRYGWSGSFLFSIQIAGLVTCVLGYSLLTWAMSTNLYFSQIVRIQSERGHSVAMNGPYHFVRHPAYTGMIMFELGMGILLASWWAILVGGICTILIIVRTALEDRTLQSELPGYVDYARLVRFRLLPGIW